jgi:hypothetical protein
LVKAIKLSSWDERVEEHAHDPWILKAPKNVGTEFYTTGKLL